MTLYEQIKEEGIEIGLKIAKERAIEEGRIKGREIAVLEMIRKMAAEAIDHETIARVSRLPLDKARKIIESDS